jgi:hypothetical protein
MARCDGLLQVIEWLYIADGNNFADEYIIKSVFGNRVPRSLCHFTVLGI